MASPQIRTPAEIIFDNTDSTAASTPSSGQTIVGVDDVTKKLYSVNDAGVKTDYGATGAGGGGSGMMGQDEGIPLGTGTTLNVVGNNVVMSISGSVLQILHTDPTFPQEVIGIFGQNAGVPLGTGVVLNVDGTRLTLSLSGTVLRLTNSPDPTDQIGVFGRNQGTNLGTGTTIDWGLGMNAAISGSVLFVHPFGGGTHGQIWKRDTGTVPGTAWDNNNYNIQFHLGDGASVVSTGSVSAGYAYVEVPDDSVIDSWTVFADATGSVKANIFRSTYAGFPPTSPLAGLGQPTLTSQRKNTGTPTGTTSLSKGDVLQIEIPTGVATVKLVTVSLQCRKI